MDLVLPAAGVQDLHVPVQVPEVDAAPFEVEGQFEEGKLPGQGRGADQGTGGVGRSAKGRGDVSGRHALAAHLGALQGRELDHGVGKVEHQVDAMTPAGVVHQPGDIEGLAKGALLDQFSGPEALVEEAVVEDHGGFAVPGVGLLQQGPGVEEVFFPHVFLAVPGDQGFFEEQTPGIQFEQGGRCLQALGFPGEDEDGVWFPTHQGFQ